MNVSGLRLPPGAKEPLVSAFVSSVFVALMSVALISDVAWNRLPNRLTLTVMLVGIATQAVFGPGAVLAGVSGVLVGFAVGMPLFALGAIGGGDVKLMAAVGAFMGPRDLLWALLLAAALGLALVVVETTRRKVLIPVLYRSKDILVYLFTFGRSGELPRLEGPGAVTVPYGVAIAVGAVCAWFFPVSEVLR